MVVKYSASVSLLEGPFSDIHKAGVPLSISINLEDL